MRSQAGDQCELGQDGQGGQQDHQPPAVHQRAPVQLHADGDEEQAQQHVVEGPDVGLDLVLVFGLGDQHPGHEGAQRQRQPGVFGQPGQAQRDQQEVEDEQLLALALGHAGEPPAHQSLAAPEQQGQQHGGLEHGQTERADDVVSPLRECRYQHQQRHHRDVLEQQHAHDPAAVLALEFEALGHHLGDDGRARHRQRRAQRHGAGPVQFPGPGQPGEQRRQQHVADHRAGDGQQHLTHAQPEHQPPHAAQLGQVELQPDHEHQEDDAELGQVADAGRIARQGQRMRADQHAHDQVAQHGRQFEQPTDDHAGHGGQQIEQGKVERGGHRGGGRGAKARAQGRSQARKGCRLESSDRKT